MSKRAAIPKKTVNTIPIIWRELDTIQPNPENPRILTKEGFERLKQSFEDNPELINGKPLLLSDRTGALVIIGGNSRYAVAQSLNYESLPTILFSGLTLEKEREILARDNVNDGEWDMEELANNWSVEKLLDWGVKVVPKKEVKREAAKKLTFTFTKDEHEEVCAYLDNLQSQTGLPDKEETLLKILRDICNPTPN